MIYTIIQVSRSFVLLIALGQECAPEVSSELPWTPVSNVKTEQTQWVAKCPIPLTWLLSGP